MAPTRQWLKRQQWLKLKERKTQDENALRNITKEDVWKAPEGFPEALAAKLELQKLLNQLHPKKPSVVTVDYSNKKQAFVLTIRGPYPPIANYKGYDLYWIRASNVWSPTAKFGLVGG